MALPSKGSSVVRDAKEKGSEHDAACWALRKGLWDGGTQGWAVTVLQPHTTPSSLETLTWTTVTGSHSRGRAHRVSGHQRP